MFPNPCLIVIERVIDLQIGFKGDLLRSESTKQRIALISKDLSIHEG